MAVRDGKAPVRRNWVMDCIWFWNAFIFTKIVFWDWNHMQHPAENVIYSITPLAVFIVLWGAISWGVVAAIVGRKLMR